MTRSQGRNNCKLRTLVKAGAGAPFSYMAHFVFASHLLANMTMWLRTVSDIAKCPQARVNAGCPLHSQIMGSA